jgi:hypothetical protein
MSTHILVEIVNDQVVTRDAAEWRHECLARFVLELPSLAARREWLADFERKHGAADINALRDTMTALHQRARAA